MILTYCFRVLPTKAQHRALEQILESQRQLYNAALQERIDAYRKQGLTRSYFDQTKALTEWRRGDQDACAVPVNLQRSTLRRVDLAFKAFFRRCRTASPAGFPRFRGKGWFRSFGFRRFSGITFNARRLRFKGMPGGLRVHLHRPLPGDIRNCFFRRDDRGWVVGFAIGESVATARDGRRAIGIDLGLSVFATMSDGTSVPSLKAARRAERKLRIANRAVSRTARRSVGRVKAWQRLQRCHASIVRRRVTYLHQVSAGVTRNHDLIAIESLPVAVSRAVVPRGTCAMRRGDVLSPSSGTKLKRLVPGWWKSMLRTLPRIVRRVDSA